jgi:hypothetical protein
MPRTAWPQPGYAVGFTAADETDGAPDPTAFSAVTVKEYLVPGVSFMTVAEVVPTGTSSVRPPGLAVTRYVVTGLP